MNTNQEDLNPKNENPKNESIATRQWNIASATKPHNPNEFMENVRSMFKSYGFTVNAIAIVPGPGCRNYGLELSGPHDEQQRIIEQLTFAMQPGKYSEINNDPALVFGEFTYEE